MYILQLHAFCDMKSIFSQTTGLLNDIPVHHCWMVSATQNPGSRSAFALKEFYLCFLLIEFL